MTLPEIRIYSGGVGWGGRSYVGYLQAYDSCPLIIDENKISGCFEVDYNGEKYTFNCSFSELLPAADNSTCDTLSTTTIEILDPSPAEAVISDSFELAVFLPSDSIQWLNCDADFSPLLGENNNFFYPSETGNYAVELIYEGACIDTSECVFISIPTNSLSEKSDAFFHIKAFPNPAHDKVLIDLGDNALSGSLEVVDVSGKRLERLDFINQMELELDLSGYVEGVYFLKVSSFRAASTIRVIKY